MSIIEEAFKKAENGTLTYEQFQELTKDAKFADLSTGDYVSKRKYEDDLAARDKQIGELNTTITTRNSDLAAIQKQLEEAGSNAEALSKLTSDMAGLQTKYDADMKAYQDKLNKQAYEFAVKEFAATKQFSSKAAKRDFVQSMINKNLQMENNVIMGAEDFVKMYSEENDDAFVTEPEPTPEPTPGKPKMFVGGTDPQPKGEESLFNFNFAGVRPH